MKINETHSTNSLLKELLAKGEWPEGEGFLYAGYQTAGRGQTGNSWESEADKNLYFLNIAVGVAIYRTVGELGISELGIKWPNDIYWQDKKLAGILLENAIIGNEIKYAIAGIGLNVNQTEFHSDAPNPISLKQITGRDYDIDSLMNALLEQVHQVLDEP